MIRSSESMSAATSSSYNKTMDQQAQLDALAQEIIDQNICPELAEQAIQLVMGAGRPDADILFIGEAPGKKEDEQGLPFIGASGKFLDLMLEAAGMDRWDTYITSIVKYRPPNNRDPKPEEKAAFWPYMVRQINIIQPEVVITLGRHSLEYMVPGAKIAEVHGVPQTIELEGRKLIVMPLYHPAAALYNGSLRQALIDDFLKVPPLIADLKKASS